MGVQYLIMTIKLQIFIHLHRVRLRLDRLGLDPLGNVGEDLLGTEHAVGVEATVVAVNFGCQTRGGLLAS
jgi:hypothetical protein